MGSKNSRFVAVLLFRSDHANKWDSIEKNSAVSSWNLCSALEIIQLEEVAFKNKEVKRKKEHIWTDKLSPKSNANNSHGSEKRLFHSIHYEDKLQSDGHPHEDDEPADERPWGGFWVLVQKFVGYAKRLLQQLSGWLGTDHHRGQHTGCGGPGLAWLHVV